MGFDCARFASTRELPDSDVPDRPGCIILDVRMPGSNGLDLQNDLAMKKGFQTHHFPHGAWRYPHDCPRTMQAGAVDFLTKPVRDQTLLDAVATAIAKEISWREAAPIVRPHVERLATLARHSEVTHRTDKTERYLEREALFPSLEWIVFHAQSNRRQSTVGNLGALAPKADMQLLLR